MSKPSVEKVTVVSRLTFTEYEFTPQQVREAILANPNFAIAQSNKENADVGFFISIENLLEHFGLWKGKGKEVTDWSVETGGSVKVNICKEDVV